MGTTNRDSLPRPSILLEFTTVIDPVTCERGLPVAESLHSGEWCHWGGINFSLRCRGGTAEAEGTVSREKNCGFSTRVPLFAPEGTFLLLFLIPRKSHSFIRLDCRHGRKKAIDIAFRSFVPALKGGLSRVQSPCIRPRPSVARDRDAKREGTKAFVRRPPPRPPAAPPPCCAVLLFILAVWPVPTGRQAGRTRGGGLT